MAELMRTNDPGLISVVEGLLIAEGIDYQVTDRNMSVMEGSVLAIPMRVLVRAEQEDAARELMEEAELGHWLRPRR